MPGAGFEPAHPNRAPGPQPGVSANSTIPALLEQQLYATSSPQVNGRKHWTTLLSEAGFVSRGEPVYVPAEWPYTRSAFDGEWGAW